MRIGDGHKPTAAVLELQMLTFLKWVFDHIDFVKIAEMQRGRANRKAAARLHLVLVTAYDIIETYEALLETLEKALVSYRVDGDRHIININSYWTAGVLRRQADNLMKMDRLLRDLYAEVKLLDPAFERTYREIFSGKFGIMFEAQMLLSQGRLPTHEDHPMPPGDQPGLTYRTLWLGEIDPGTDREKERKYLHPINGTEKDVIDVHSSDGLAFAKELKRYFEIEKPYDRLDELRQAADTYKQALAANLTLSDVLAEIGSIKRT
jgi:tetratricopeptide (TPR) repeat protein